MEKLNIDGILPDGTCTLSAGETTVAAGVRTDHAARLVACWDACDKLRAQVAELSAALQRAMLHIDPTSAQGEQCRAQARAALALHKDQWKKSRTATESWVAWLDGKRDEAVKFDAPVCGTFDIAFAGAAALGIEVCEELNVARA